ncbi:unnamed protein product [Rotaria magnacalcarata]|uniref:Uncharacterized protein n=2 Tax=Rotaria magnacalcarata TaxID=392030 RepID=A0A814IPF2_9BILA|nr:unnamed protein product [Rotaria magnacalcarata]CAF1651168.1 unnamed protein product [Rotaria magnacalcarata]CAF1958737.1 unnamed protein product [Rotaria magnacalcarata]CAF3747524.1 unnamed protein product [Rotaria magnacalcarata]CAF3780260.1 unnamed protein product [Rotaria magnacalcarata]
MSTIIRDNFISYATLIYTNLKTIKPNRPYHGLSYRAALVTSRDMINYQAAMAKGNLIETLLFSSTSKNRRVVETFTIGGSSCDSHLATIIFDFTKRPCETTKGEKADRGIVGLYGSYGSHGSPPYPAYENIMKIERIKK